MSTAPNGGTDTTPGKERASRQQPEGPKNQSSSPKPGHSASAPKSQGPRLVRENGEKRILDGDVVYHTTRADNPEQQKSAFAVATRILAQMGRLHAAIGGFGNDLDRAEIWFEVALDQITTIETSRPKWRYKPEWWLPKYAPQLAAARSKEWLDDRIRDHRQRRRFYKSDVIGTMLGVTVEQFRAGKLWHIWPAGITEAERKRLSMDFKAAWQRSDRAKKGATPREQSLACTKPWVAMGMSRSTWWRMKQAGRL